MFYQCDLSLYDLYLGCRRWIRFFADPWPCRTHWKFLESSRLNTSKMLFSREFSARRHTFSPKYLFSFCCSVAEKVQIFQLFREIFAKLKKEWGQKKIDVIGKKVRQPHSLN